MLTTKCCVMRMGFSLRSPVEWTSIEQTPLRHYTGWQQQGGLVIEFSSKNIHDVYVDCYCSEITKYFQVTGPGKSYAQLFWMCQQKHEPFAQCTNLRASRRLSGDYKSFRFHVSCVWKILYEFIKSDLDLSEILCPVVIFLTSDNILSSMNENDNIFEFWTGANYSYKLHAMGPLPEQLQLWTDQDVVRVNCAASCEIDWNSASLRTFQSPLAIRPPFMRHRDLMLTQAVLSQATTSTTSIAHWAHTNTERERDRAQRHSTFYKQTTTPCLTLFSLSAVADWLGLYALGSPITHHQTIMPRNASSSSSYHRRPH